MTSPARSRSGATGCIVDAVHDRRSRRVVFVSHCLLNENVRYLGGACRPGVVEELAGAWCAAGVGICQMPCPEQHAWGGVLKPRMLSAYASRGTLRHRLRRPLAALLLLWTRLVYRRLARRVAADVAAYRRASMDVTEMVMVAGSPSCGATMTLDVRRAVDGLAALPRDGLNADAVNRVVLDCAVPGTGMFTGALQRALRRRGLAVPVSEHDLLAELRGQQLPSADR